MLRRCGAFAFCKEDNLEKSPTEMLGNIIALIWLLPCSIVIIRDKVQSVKQNMKDFSYLCIYCR